MYIVQGHDQETRTKGPGYRKGPVFFFLLWLDEAVSSAARRVATATYIFAKVANFAQITKIANFAKLTEVANFAKAGSLFEANAH